MLHAASIYAHDSEFALDLILEALLQVLDAAWDMNTGGSQLDVLIAEHLGRQFNAGSASGDDVLQHPKAMAKLKKQVRVPPAAHPRYESSRRLTSSSPVICNAPLPMDGFI